MDLAELTIGSISQAIVFLGGLIGGIIYLKQNIHQWVLGDTDKKLASIQLESCKDYVVLVIGDLERGIPLSDTEIQRFYDRYTMYKDGGGNGYIRAKVEELQKKGILKAIPEN